jgi:hypothetical protein
VYGILFRRIFKFRIEYKCAGGDNEGSLRYFDVESTPLFFGRVALIMQKYVPPGISLYIKPYSVFYLSDKNAAIWTAQSTCGRAVSIALSDTPFNPEAFNDSTRREVCACDAVPATYNDGVVYIIFWPRRFVSSLLDAIIDMQTFEVVVNAIVHLADRMLELRLAWAHWSVDKLMIAETGDNSMALTVATANEIFTYGERGMPDCDFPAGFEDNRGRAIRECVGVEGYFNTATYNHDLCCKTHRMMHLWSMLLCVCEWAIRSGRASGVHHVCLQCIGTDLDLNPTNACVMEAVIRGMHTDNPRVLDFFIEFSMLRMKVLHELDRGSL